MTQNVSKKEEPAKAQEMSKKETDYPKVEKQLPEEVFNSYGKVNRKEYRWEFLHIRQGHYFIDNDIYRAIETVIQETEVTLLGNVHAVVLQSWKPLGKKC